MGGPQIYVTTELRTRDPENDNSIPTPVSSIPSTPTFSQSLKRKFEEDPPYLDLSGRILANKYQRFDRFDRFDPRYSPQSPKSSQSFESPLHPPSRASRTASDMSFIVQPFSFVIGKITAFTGELWNQFKASPASVEDSVIETGLESSPEPTQEPTPETTPEPTSEPGSEAGPVVTASAPKAAPPLLVTKAAGTPKKTTNDAQRKKDVFWLLADTVARRDAVPKWKHINRHRPTEAFKEQARRASRVRISQFTGSPLTSSRARGDELRRSRRQRPSRTAQV
ncbi:hypothetical protein L211DRAFT_813391 [Terfezia boudieri ATCC MYA-4762]|uniref:Uncharacterized protein n=1 Tax=Terfezia boudieri ATCC MYA-4762 TaxID=1051890 RepID=A0A3N4LBY8_9PEZI|nr:hypothetical protein L211DRAFT_813391 [Terfezia boudieri ATCC MYA-4762]